MHDTYSASANPSIATIRGCVHNRRPCAAPQNPILRVPCTRIGKTPGRRNRTPASLNAPRVEVSSEHQPDSSRHACLFSKKCLSNLIHNFATEKWTHWDLNPGPSACEADVMPLHHAPNCKLASGRLGLFFLMQLGPCNKASAGRKRAPLGKDTRPDSNRVQQARTPCRIRTGSGRQKQPAFFSSGKFFAFKFEGWSAKQPGDRAAALHSTTVVAVRELSAALEHVAP